MFTEYDYEVWYISVDGILCRMLDDLTKVMAAFSAAVNEAADAIANACLFLAEQYR